MFSDAQLAAMRTTASLVMNTAAVVARSTRSSDSAGGFTSSDTIVWSGNVGIEPASEREWAQYAGKIGTRRAISIRLPATATVATGDLVTADGVSYEVLGVKLFDPLVMKLALGVALD